jgi:hypothetical protein
LRYPWLKEDGMKPDFGKEATTVMDDELVRTLADQSREGEPALEALPPTTQVEVLAITDDGVVFDESPTVPKISELPPPAPEASPEPAPEASPTPAPAGRLRTARHLGVIVSVGALLMLGLGHHELSAPPVAAISTSNVLGVFELPGRMFAALDQARSWLESGVKKAPEPEPEPVDNAEPIARPKHHHHHRG